MTFKDGKKLSLDLLEEYSYAYLKACNVYAKTYSSWDTKQDFDQDCRLYMLELIDSYQPGEQSLSTYIANMLPKKLIDSVRYKNRHNSYGLSEPPDGEDLVIEVKLSDPLELLVFQFIKEGMSERGISKLLEISRPYAHQLVNNVMAVI